MLGVEFDLRASFLNHFETLWTCDVHKRGFSKTNSGFSKKTPRDSEFSQKDSGFTQEVLGSSQKDSGFSQTHAGCSSPVDYLWKVTQLPLNLRVE